MTNLMYLRCSKATDVSVSVYADTEKNNPKQIEQILRVNKSQWCSLQYPPHLSVHFIIWKGGQGSYGT